MANQSKGEGVVAFLTRHQRFVTFTGAVIVFVTFIVKEGIKDHYKDLASSVDSAQSLFIICDTIRVEPEIFDRLLEVGKMKWGQEQVDERIKIMRQDVKYVMATLSTTRRLLERLPHQEERLARLAKLEGQICSESTAGLAQHAMELDNDIIKNATAEINAVNSNKKTKRQSPEIIGVDVAMRIFNVVPLEIKTKQLADESLEIAEEIKARSEGRYRIASYLSYALYTLGWGIALAGRIFGVGAGVGGE